MHTYICTFIKILGRFSRLAKLKEIPFLSKNYLFLLESEVFKEDREISSILNGQNPHAGDFTVSFIYSPFLHHKSPDTSVARTNGALMTHKLEAKEYSPALAL